MTYVIELLDGQTQKHRLIFPNKKVLCLERHQKRYYAVFWDDIVKLISMCLGQVAP
jgi:hypothetical protein